MVDELIEALMKYPISVDSSISVQAKEVKWNNTVKLGGIAEVTRDGLYITVIGWYVGRIDVCSLHLEDVFFDVISR